MNENLGSLLAGFGLCYAGGRLLSVHLGRISSARFRNLVYRCCRRQWMSAFLGIAFSTVINKPSILAMIVVSLITAGMMTVSQAFPMVVWGNVGSVLIVYLAVIDVRILALFMIGIAGVAYGFGGKSKYSNTFACMLAIGMLIFGVVLVKNSGTGTFDSDWIQRVTAVLDERIWLPFLLGAVLKIVIQSGFVLALFEISLLQASVINLEQMVAIFLGSRLAASILSWLLSAPYRSAGKQLMMIQVFYNVVGSLVFLLILFAGHILNIPIMERVLTGLSDDASMQVAFMALLYCLVTSIIMTTIKRPVLSAVKRVWAVDNDSEIGKTRYINEQALEHPETAIELAEKEQSGLMQYLTSQMAEMRRSMEAKNENSSCAQYHHAFRAVAKELNAYLIDLGNRDLSQQSFKRFLSIQDRQGILTSLESHVFKFASEDKCATSEQPIYDMASKFLEALDFILTTAHEACDTRTETDIEILKSITSDRTAQMEHFRAEFLSKFAKADSLIKNRMWDITVLFEKAVWLAHLLAESLDAQELPIAFSNSVPKD